MLWRDGVPLAELLARAISGDVELKSFGKHPATAQSYHRSCSSDYALRRGDEIAAGSSAIVEPTSDFRTKKVWNKRPVGATGAAFFLFRGINGN